MRLFLRSAFFIVLLVFVDLIFYSCRKPKDYNYKYSSANLNIYDYNTSPGGSTSYMNDNDTAKIEFLHIDVQLIPEILAISMPSPGFLFNPAYAFTFYDNFTNTSLLKSIEIKTLEDFNLNYKAGSLMQNSMYFGLGYSTSKTDSIYGAVALVETFNNAPEYRHNLDKMPYYGTFWIKFAEKPKPNSPQQFAIEVELEDGRILRDTTVRFIVK